MKQISTLAEVLAITTLLLGPMMNSGPAAIVGHWTFERGEARVDRTGNFPDLLLRGDAQVVDGKLDVNGSGTAASGWAVTDSGTGSYQGPAISNKTLVVWAELQGLADMANAGSLLTIDAVSSDHFDGIIYGERQPNRWENGSSFWNRTQDFDPGFEETEVGVPFQLAITYQDLGDGQMLVSGYRNGEPIGQYQTGNPSAWSTGNAEIFFGIRHGTVSGGGGALDALISEARLYDTALTAEEILALYNSGPVVLVDSDGDSLRDDWEMQYFSNLAQTATGDPDADGVTNGDELDRTTNPTKADTDDDGLNDGVETNTGIYIDVSDTGTDPWSPDTDNDGLKDGVETYTAVYVSPNDTGTDPLRADSDSDRHKDGEEVAAGTDPNDPKDPPTTLRDLLVGHWTFEPGVELVDQTGNFPSLALKGNATIVDGKLDLNGTGTTASGWAVTDSSAGQYTGPVITNKTLVAWVTLQGLESAAKAGSALTLDKVNSDGFDGIIFAERQANRWMNGSSGWSRTADFNPGAEETAVGALTQIAISYEHIADGKIRITGYRNGIQIGQYEAGSPSRWEPGDAEALFGVRHGSVAGGNGALDALISEASIYGTALTAQQISQLYNLGPEDSIPLIGHWIFEPGQELQDQTGNFPKLVLQGNAKVLNGQLEVTGSGISATGWAMTDSANDSYRGPLIESKTLMVWGKLNTLQDGATAGSMLTLDRVSADQFDGIIFAEQQANRWMNGSSFWNRTQSFDPGYEETTVGDWLNLAITYEHITDVGILRVTGYRNGEQIGQYEVSSLSSWESGDAEVLFGVRHFQGTSHPGALNAKIEEARIYGGALPPERILEIFQKGPIASEDRDADGLPDTWEMDHFGNLDQTLAGDPDADGLANSEEYKRDTNPANADTDDDGWKDGVETKTGIFVSATDTGTDPLNPDTDNDGLKDGAENPLLPYDPARPQQQAGTHPFKPDSDGDGYVDGAEVTAGTNPANPLDPQPEPIAPYLVGHWTFNAGAEQKDLTGNFPDLLLQGDAQVVEGKLDVNGGGTSASGWAVTDSGVGAYAGPAISNKTLVVWAELQGLADVASAGSLLTIDAVNSDHFDGIIYGEQQPNRWMNGSSNWNRTQNFTPGFEETEVGVPFQLAITYKHLGDGQMLVSGYRNGEPIGQYQTGNASQWSPGDAEVFFGIRHGSINGGGGALDALIDEARIYATALSAYQVKELFSPTLSLSFSRVGNRIRIEWSDTGAKLQYTDNINGTWTDVPNASSPYEQEFSATVRRFFRLSK